MMLLTNIRWLIVFERAVLSLMLLSVFAAILIYSAAAQNEDNSSDLLDLNVLFILQNDTIHRYYLSESVKDWKLNNTVINLTIYDPDEASDNDLSSFDII